MTKYKLLRDCPHGKKDSVWEQNGDFADWFVLTHEDDIEKIGWFFPKSTFSDWFEEIKLMQLFTREQAAEIQQKLNKIETDTEGSISYYHFLSWLDQNTEGISKE